VKDYLFWFDMPGEHIAGTVVTAGASAIRADFAAADHRYARQPLPWMPTGKQFGSRTRIAGTVNVSLCVQMKR